jgi:hypothetical protein
LVGELELELVLELALEVVVEPPPGQTQVQVVSRASRLKAVATPSREVPMRTLLVKCMIVV